PKPPRAAQAASNGWAVVAQFGEPQFELSLQDRPADRYDWPSKRRVRHFRERKIERVEPGSEASPTSCVAPGQSHSQVAPRKQKERDPQQQENGPQREVRAERRDPHIKGEDSPHQ